MLLWSLDDKKTCWFVFMTMVLCFLPQIESYLYRNHETRKYLQEQAYRLQQGIVTTTTQQVCKQKLLSHMQSIPEMFKNIYASGHM